MEYRDTTRRIFLGKKQICLTTRDPPAPFTSVSLAHHNSVAAVQFIANCKSNLS